MSAYSLPYFLLQFGRTRASAVPAVELAPADEALLVLVREGDREALGMLFVRYSRPVLTVGRKLLRNRAEAEDLVHDVFLSVLDKAHQFDPRKGSARAWLARIAYHRAIERRRSLLRGHFYDGHQEGDWSPQLFELVDPIGMPDPIWSPQLEAAYALLTDEQRNTLQLHFFEGMNIAEIAGYMGRAPGQVRHYYYRGLEQLRRGMGIEKQFSIRKGKWPKPERLS